MPEMKAKHGSHQDVYTGKETRHNKYAKFSKADQHAKKLAAPAKITFKGKPGQRIAKGTLEQLGEWLYKVPHDVFIPDSGTIDVECAALRPAK